ncbi:conjugative transfer signal peptidase TraF [Ramlibacter sp. H39-3-26]|uniref:conjugative transfer signal peptidase TraF n=1 Tax=Curvibacter soli TaxID=3031331 RepID=UPI0023DB8C88|nr:conjugative transfer signal peptidase TraF [Ramlibacter sp. H39-3-26]MDF1486013.1 conjugative transfer signal peptidase TraF [Ramlibacter sp. H39-3-26]
MQHRPFQRAMARIAITIAAALALAACGYGAGARVNTTRSIPVGLYWTSAAPIARGAYVMFCPPPAPAFDEALRRGYIGAGFCPGGYGYMMKRVLAAAGDAVAVADDGVRVNGVLLAHSAPIAADKAGRPLPRYRSGARVLGGAQLLLMSDVSATSFDGRYFGPIDRAQVQAVVRPIVTW